MFSIFFSNLVVRMNQNEESGKYLSEDEEIEEEPTLCWGGCGGEIAEEMLAVALILSQRIEHLAVAPVNPANILPTHAINRNTDFFRTFGSRIIKIPMQCWGS